jgi:hypothetical protein
MRILFFTFILISSLGCSSISDTFVFNGKSAQTIQTDIDHLFKKLPRNKKQRFFMVLLAIQFSDVGSVNDMLADPAMEGINYDILSKKLNGLTYTQAIELASNSQTKVRVSKK